MKTGMMKMIVVMVAAAVSAQCLNTWSAEKEEHFKLESGPYLMKVNTVQKGGSRNMTTKIIISVADNNITFHTAHASKTTKGEINGNDFTATISENGETTLQGKLISDNRISGEFFPSKDVDFPSEVSGTFVIEPDKDKDAVTFWENEEKWRAEKTAVPELTEREKFQLQRLQEAYRQNAEKYNVPISFYGKVIDENNKPVKDAKTEIQIVKFASEVDLKEPIMTTNIPKRMKTDENGLFQIPMSEGKIGFRLDVSVSKEGYKWINNGDRLEKSFKYSQRDLQDEVFTPDPENPVVFILKADQ